VARAAESTMRCAGLGGGLAAVGFAVGTAFGGWAVALGPAIGESVGVAIGVALASPYRRAQMARGEGGYVFARPHRS
jgi:hypothetical protein